MTLFSRTSAPIQTAMLVEMVRLLQECQQTVNLPELGKAPEKPEKSAEAQRLESMGFTNAQPILDYKRQKEEWETRLKEYNKGVGAVANALGLKAARVKTVKTLIAARETFGEDTLLIPYLDFERLMRKYNLVCGPFSSYRGEIPSDKVEEIARLQQLIKQKKYDYINKLAPLTGLKYSDSEYMWFNVPGYIKRFPFAKKDRDYNSWWAAWLVDMHGNKIRDSWKWEYEVGNPVELFICAPSKHMEKIRALRVPHLISYSDPFICAHTDYGILVFTRWGEEADDAIIKKYESANRWLDKAREFIGNSFSVIERRGGFCN